MRTRVNIFVEGEADKKFFADFLRFLKIDNNSYNIIELRGKDNLFKETIINLIQSNTDNGGKNLVIIDADNSKEDRENEILERNKVYNLCFDLFIMPNNKDKGALEDLLEQIINTDNQPIFDCWNNYEGELKTIKITNRPNPLTIPTKKTKIYAYLEVLLGNSRKEKELIKEKNRDYLNKSHWDLGASYLIPLKEFILKYFDR